MSVKLAPAFLAVFVVELSVTNDVNCLVACIAAPFGRYKPYDKPLTDVGVTMMDGIVTLANTCKKVSVHGCSIRVIVYMTSRPFVIYALVM